MSTVQGDDAMNGPSWNLRVLTSLAPILLFHLLVILPALAGGHGGQHCGKKNCLSTITIAEVGSFELNLGGSGATDLLTDSSGKVIPRESFHWVETLLFSRHEALGDVLVSLNPQMISTGELVPATPDAFFPASAVNHFFFIMELPDLDLRLFNKEPLTNSATIDDFPPFGSAYVMNQPVPFFNVDDPTGPPVVTIEASEVAISPEEGLECVISSITAAPDDRIRFGGTISNLTPEEDVDLVWYVTSREGVLSGHQPFYSIATVGGAPLAIDVVSEFSGDHATGVFELYSASLAGGHRWCFDSVEVANPHLGPPAIPTLGRLGIVVLVASLLALGALWILARTRSADRGPSY
jgi:hypothetical protein